MSQNEIQSSGIRRGEGRERRGNEEEQENTTGTSQAPCSQHPSSQPENSSETNSDASLKQCHEFLGGESNREDAVFRGTVEISKSNLSNEGKQELQQFLLDTTDKGKGVEEHGGREENRDGREERDLLRRILGTGDGEGSINQDGEGDEGEGVRAVGKVGRIRDGDESRKRKLREEDLPWFESVRSSKLKLSEEKLKTRKLLRDYREDIEMVVQSIQSAPDGPTNFPTSEWKNVVRGKPVNLNAVFGGLHTFKSVSESIGRVGPFEIRSEVNESSKHIETAAQWISAWDETIQATEVAFPHRGRELRDYGRDIRRLFDSVAPKFHKRIFLYDEAVRGSVRGGETLSLTDSRAFQHLYTAYILPIGSEVQSTQRSGNKPKFGQLCRNFNRQGCAIRNCRFRHFCGMCGDAQHGRVDCPKGKCGGDNQA